MSRAQEIYQAVTAYLEKKNLPYEPHPDAGLVHLEINRDVLPMHIFLRAVDSSDALQVICPQGTKVPVEKRTDVAVAVSVANYGMVNGGFDLNIKDGSLHFRLCHSCKAGLPDDEQLRYLIGCAASTMKQYQERFFMLIKGMIDLEKFLELEKAD